MTVAALRYAGFEKAVFIMAGDESDEVRKAFLEYETALKQLEIPCYLLVVGGLNDNNNNDHQRNSNLSIAAMQGVAWAKARELDADELWSLESDILPQAKVLRTMRGVVGLDDWYDVVMCTYPNEGFLGGYGTPRNWIAPNVYEDERELSADVRNLLEKKKEREKKLQKAGQNPTPKDLKEWKELDKLINESKPKGNVFALNAPRWRPRGWLEHAYPGVGLGAVLPTMWVGLGCTYMSKKALSIANFEGYNGDGTQDLYLCWRVWHPSRIQMAVTTHAICSHVKRRRTEKGIKTEILHARHELGGEAHGHLRVDRVPWKGD